MANSNFRNISGEKYRILKDKINQALSQTPIFAKNCPDRWPTFFKLRNELRNYVLDAWEDGAPRASSNAKRSLRGKILMHPSADVREFVSITGVCFIGKDARIGPNAFIHGDNIVAERCVVGFGVEVKDSLLSAGVRIYHFGFIGDSLLGAEANVGAGAITAVRNLKSRWKPKRGVILGPRSEIGVGGLMMPGSFIPGGKVILPGEKIF